MKLYLTFSIILILVGFYYIAAEFITIAATKETIKSYSSHTISELGVPLGSDYYGNQSTFSPLSKIMNSAFVLTGIFFAVCYSYIIVFRINNLNRYICIMLATSISIGVILVGLFHGDGTNTLHNVGTVMVFSSTGAVMLFTGLSIDSKAFFKVVYIILGIISLLSAIIFIGFRIGGINLFAPILERLVIYPIVLFEIIYGYQMIGIALYS